ncbi:MAG: CvpA family protein [Planctomycetota bacterium]
MAVVDLLVVAALGVGVTLGALRGFVPQVTGVFGLGGGLYLAARFHDTLRTHIFDPNWTWSFNGEAAFISIIIVTILVAALIGFLLRRLIASVGLGTYDRIIGGAFGAAKAALLAAGILLGIVYFAPNGGGLEQAIGGSRAGPAFWRAMDEMADFLPEEVAGPVEAFLDDNPLPEQAPKPALKPDPAAQEEPPPVDLPLRVDE